MIKLYTYFRSSAAYRVRIALNLKQIPYQSISVHLLKNGGEQNSEEYAKINHAKVVPYLVDSQKQIELGQSLAIIEYLDEAYPNTVKMLLGDFINKAKIRSFALNIACEIHPLGNLRVLQFLTNKLKITEQEKQTWLNRWIIEGLKICEKELELNNSNGKFCFGDSPTLADCYLIPQVFNAKRFHFDISAMPLIQNVYKHCSALPAFDSAHPASQSDAK